MDYLSKLPGGTPVTTRLVRDYLLANYQASTSFGRVGSEIQRFVKVQRQLHVDLVREPGLEIASKKLMP